MKQVIILDPDTKKTINDLTRKGEQIIDELTKKGESIVADLTQRTEAIMAESLDKFQDSIQVVERLAVAVEKLAEIIDEVDDNLDGAKEETEESDDEPEGNTVPEGKVIITETFEGVHIPGAESAR